MPSDISLSVVGKPSSMSHQSQSQYDYYQHDKDESLNVMTNGGVGIPPSTIPSARSVSTTATNESIASAPESSVIEAPSPSLSSPRKSKNASSIKYRGFPHHRIINVNNEEGSRIPRRVKSTPNAAVGTIDLNLTGARNCNSMIVGGSGDAKVHNTTLKRSNFTNAAAGAVPAAAVSNVFGIVSNCLLSNPMVGDGISLDPEVDLWLDMIPLSRKPFKNFHRDFADGVLMAEIMAFFFPKRVDLHNYVPASASSSKRANYDTLNQKVFSKMGLKIPDNLIDGIILSKPGSIEKALRLVHRFIDNGGRRQTEFRAKELSALAGSYNGTPFLDAPYTEELCLVRNIPGEIPDCVIYQNIKYFPCSTLDEIAKNEEQLREKNNELCNKVRRLETLINLKESHLKDLTSKIHELRAKYELPAEEKADK